LVVLLGSVEKRKIKRINMSAKLQWIQEELQNLKDAGLYNQIRTLGSPQGAWLVVDGQRVLNFCSNNYLGLANHPRIVDAARKAVEEFGVGPAAVRTIAGTMDLHLQLEERLAAFKGVESAITFQSGFMANVGCIPALVGKGESSQPSPSNPDSLPMWVAFLPLLVGETQFSPMSSIMPALSMVRAYRVHRSCDMLIVIPRI
jgi:hypothetical protein